MDLCKLISDYWRRQSPSIELDPQTLDWVVKSLTDEEREVLETGYGNLGHYERKAFIFTLYKVRNRVVDIQKGVTQMGENFEVITSQDSSITELDISLDTMNNCNQCLIYKLNDIVGDYIAGLELEAIAEVTGQVIIWNALHGVA